MGHGSKPQYDSVDDTHTREAMQRESFVDMASAAPSTKTVSQNDDGTRHEVISSNTVTEDPLVERSSIRKRRRDALATAEDDASSPTPQSPYDELFDLDFPECGMEDNVQLPDLRAHNHSEADRLSPTWLCTRRPLTMAASITNYQYPECEYQVCVEGVSHWMKESVVQQIYPELLKSFQHKTGLIHLPQRKRPMMVDITDPGTRDTRGTRSTKRVRKDIDEDKKKIVITISH